MAGRDAVIGWDRPSDGQSFTTPPPNIAAIPALPATVVDTNNSSVATEFNALGIHVPTGTLYAFERATSTLYQYSMSTGIGWVTTSLSQIPSYRTGVANNNIFNNFNKMAVIGNTLVIANSTIGDILPGNNATSKPSRVFTFAITPTSGAVSTSGTDQFFSRSIASGATNAPSSVRIATLSINGGDITQDEYGDVYQVTYDNLSNASTTQYLYIYKQNGTVWEFKARIPKVINSDNYAGAAFYNDGLYIKGSKGTGVTGQVPLYKLPLTRLNGTDYNWSGSISLVSVGMGNQVTDLASCGVPQVFVTKDQQVSIDPAGTTATPNQTRIGAGQYIKYTIVAKNYGDAWARGLTLTDALPLGVTYVPHTATKNGVVISPIGSPDDPYPFASILATSAGTNTTEGQIRLASLSGNTDTATYTYIVRVTGSVGTVQNTVSVKGSTTEVNTESNTATTPLLGIYPSIFGTVVDDKDGSAAGGFSNIQTGAEVGTNTGTASVLNAILVDGSGGLISTTPVASDGTYSFAAIDRNQTGLKIQLSTTPGVLGNPLPSPGIPAPWKSTSPKITAPFDVGLADIPSKDFGIGLPAGMVLVKRITGIKSVGANLINRLTNPNETGTTARQLNQVLHNPQDLNNHDLNANWLPNYLVGAVDAGVVKAGDEVEYTIYYLNTQGLDTTNFTICDPIRGTQSYVSGSMELKSGRSAILGLSDPIDSIDRAYSYGAASPIAVTPVATPTNCNAIVSDRGGVAIGITGSTSTNQPALTRVPSANGVGSPVESYGWFRFRTKVD